MLSSSRLWLLILALNVLGIAQAQTRPLDPADTESIRSVIEAQLAAFRADDASKAFSFASAGIRQKFESAENFMDMVRAAYPAVYRPASVSFQEPEAADDETLQKVELEDADGRLWLAVYRMQRQPDGAWLIDGCVLARIDGSKT